MSEITSRTYELGYILVPTTPEAEVASAVEALIATITGKGGIVVAQGDPEFIDLAYTMEKNVASKKFKWSQGYFGWIKFDTAPETLEALKKAFDGNQTLIRYILIKTTAENTIVFKKPKVEAKREAFLSDEEMAALESATEEEIVDEVADHEKLPELSEDIAPATTPSLEE